MRISHFFIDRPIFAVGRLDRVRHPRRRRLVRACRSRSIRRSRRRSSTSPASIPAPAPRSSPRRWWRRSSSRSTASRACSTSPRTRPPTAASRSRSPSSSAPISTSPRCRCRTASRSRTPRLPRGGAQHRRHRRQELARPPDGGAPLLARQVARHAVHLQLRQHPDQRRADPHRRRRLDHGVRQPRLFDAGLARSRPAAVART